MKLDRTISAIVTGGASRLRFASVRALTVSGAGLAIFDFNDEGSACAVDIGAPFVRADMASDDGVQAGPR